MTGNFLSNLKEKKQVIKTSLVVLAGVAAMHGGITMFRASAMISAGAEPEQTVDMPQKDSLEKKESDVVPVESGVAVDEMQSDSSYDASVSQADFIVDGIQYRVCSDDTVNITKLIDKEKEVVDIKKQVEYQGHTYVVDSIECLAFRGCNAKVINLPEEGININEYSFNGCKNLTTINNLEKAKILNSLAMFKDCVSLVSFRLPEDLTAVGDDMFNGCTSLRSIVIGRNVKNIGEGSFGDCVNLKTVDVEKGSVLEIIGKESFCGCTALERVNVASDSGLMNIESGAFAACKRLKEFILPCSVQEIGDFAFMDCYELGSINVRESVKIGRCSFPKSCEVIGIKYVYDESLEEQNKQLEDFVEGVLRSEAEKGRDLNEVVNNEVLDKVLYEYAPKTKDGKSAIDVPEVVSQGEFDKDKEGKLVLYRGQSTLKKRGKLVMTSEEACERFKRGPFYFPLECNGIYCTRSADHARTYGRTLQFYFKDEPKVITDEEAYVIVAFYKYRHIENSLKGINCYRASFSMLLKNLGIGTMQEHTFIPRALGYDMRWDKLFDGIVSDGDCTKGMLTTQYEVFYRSKLVVCEKDLLGCFSEVAADIW